MEDETVSRTYRVKSYLAANCANCHQPGGTAAGTWDGRISTILPKGNLIYGSLQNANGDPNNRVVVPGDLAHSALLQRISTSSTDRMPPIGSRVLDRKAIELLTAWINEDLRSYETYEQWRDRTFAGQSGIDTSAEGDPDKDTVRNYAEYLAGTDPLSKGSLRVETKISGSTVSYSFVQPPNRGLLLEAADRSVNPSWELLQNPLNVLSFPSSPMGRQLDLPASGQQRFYRLRVVEP
jgi:hypothetical protein